MAYYLPRKIPFGDFARAKIGPKWAGILVKSIWQDPNAVGNIFQ